jgi:hypothetical protein
MLERSTNEDASKGMWKAARQGATAGVLVGGALLLLYVLLILA